MERYMAHADKVNIMIADDDPAMRQLLGIILCSEGYTKLEYASDGQQALDLLSNATLPVHMAFLDINMPGFSGLEVMEMCKPKAPDCFYVIISANSAMENVVAALKKGARGFIVKPYTAGKIHEILAKFKASATT